MQVLIRREESTGSNRGGKGVQVAIGEGREYTYMYSDGREEEDSHR